MSGIHTPDHPVSQLIRLPLDMLRHPALDMRVHAAVLELQASDGGIPVPTPPAAFAAVFTFLLDVKAKTKGTRLAEHAARMLEEMYVFTISRPYQPVAAATARAEAAETERAAHLAAHVDTLQLQVAALQEQLAGVLLQGGSASTSNSTSHAATPTSPLTPAPPTPTASPPSPAGSIGLCRASPPTPGSAQAILAAWNAGSVGSRTSVNGRSRHSLGVQSAQSGQSGRLRPK